MRRVFMILAALYLMRSVTMFVTVLPVSSHKYYCAPKMNATSSVVVLKRAWQLMIGFGLSINGKHTYCGDYIYSGHTVILVMSYLIIAECELSTSFRLVGS
jgi:shingomyelin synthase